MVLFKDEVLGLKDTGVRIRALYNPMDLACYYDGGGVRVRIVKREARDLLSLRAEWEKVSENTIMDAGVPPDLILGGQAGQELMDDLFAAGFRPRAAAGSAGQLDAVKNHLDDMRRIVAGRLKVELP